MSRSIVVVKWLNMRPPPPPNPLFLPPLSFYLSSWSIGLSTAAASFFPIEKLSVSTGVPSAGRNGMDGKRVLLCEVRHVFIGLI